MGVSFINISKSTFDGNVKNPNPNPLSYIIGRYEERNGHLVVLITYPDCTNFEGKKILVYLNTSLDQLKQQCAIDPHFSSTTKMKSPFARFRPTREGWDTAVNLISNI